MNKFLYYPLKPFVITQKFAENAVTYYKEVAKLLGHDGWDMVGSMGQNFYASCDGVAHAERDSRGGLGVVLITDESFYYNNQWIQFKVIFWHCKEGSLIYPLNPNDPFKTLSVKRGDILGQCDSTGVVLGTIDESHSHLHFGIKPCIYDTSAEPPYYRNILQNNGYDGCLDPADYWTGFYYDLQELPSPVTVEVPIAPDISDPIQRNAIIQTIINLYAKVVQLLIQLIKLTK